MSTPQSVVKNFVEALSVSFEDSLYLNVADFGKAPSELAGFRVATSFGWQDSLQDCEQFDFIYGYLPLGMQRDEYVVGGEKLKVRRNWIELHKSLRYLRDEGKALYLVEPSAFSSTDGERFLNALNTEGFYLSAIYEPPANLLQPETGITPVLVQITHLNPESVFVGELVSEEQIAQLLGNSKTTQSSENLVEGMFLAHGSFHSFDRIRTELELEALETQYKEYKRHPLGELIIEINSKQKNETFTDIENCIYVQKLGSFRIATTLHDISGKHSSYFQVVLKPDVSAKYLACFLASEMGQLSLRSIARGSIVSNLSSRDLSEMLVSVPSPEVQETIATTSIRLSDLREAVDGLGGEFALNPSGSKQLLSQVEAMLEVIGGLTEEDRILSICRAGESVDTEFKETLSLDVRKGTREKYIELSALKTVAAFLNTQGGVLLIGITDDGDVSGLDIEITKFHKNADKYLLHFKNLLKSKIGQEYYPFINYGLVHVQGLLVLKVACVPSKSPCYFDGTEFYVRTNPATDKLEGQKLVEYVKNHFS